MKLKITQRNQITLEDWNKLVEETYKRPYDFQQQEGCQDRGVYTINIPEEFSEEEIQEIVPEIVNGEEMCVKFSSWLKRDPEQLLENEKYKWERTLWWQRNFYPHIQMIANDLHLKGLIPAGEYDIKVD